METFEAVEFFGETIATLQQVLECEPRLIAHDLHPACCLAQAVEA
ncbi:MAG: hypothetical protein R6X35_07310 [Candidatus Krumholzibacteriia bacterium]